MRQPNIIMTRVDERLIHGQGQLWIKFLNCNTVIVANDAVAEDKIQQSLMKTVVPSSIAMRFFSIQKVIDVIHKASPAQTIFIVVKDLEDIKRLVEGGVPIKEVNLGNIHKTDDKIAITQFISLGDKDKAIIRTLTYNHHIVFNTKTTPAGNGASEVNILDYI
ncbi:PTS system mannose/fructose/N-acetylgalactosamine-transporter subunit IIB [Streptococcus equi subsp. zooepidemicus]|uniref:N-acetylgalactosamine-specific phosphotransferase enzyme IIB component AgaB n=1 Tax=Streptococcus equi subsp. zooepidemicus (strain MGCS10565) TaxID=552526 RepID=B4U3S5_STREM|nr:PTS system mannose/fructose/N-acetylgalactosamine-transporter subunit IIB [Streptococcus equi]ACG62642.1 N-acetylgalactosamine-specific phosphotransferase enzyme IIB component AgaB [Streptococcus equi subsp. zooepidemicus MGCS10565]MCD3415901.1 PTS system mannose/fructose/N-acetylgalactosamine-transporter subunit IIB [Streptococcus equi subsp. zooepidemicus]MDI5917589.1 PTS system mannose/fructose/N-acetylgalactosamine-transporter subunit IIB [Streptococcus equi subsp. zooepidemicus]MDI59557